MSININNLSYTYSKGTPYEKKAVNDVTINIEEGEFLGIIGHTGSGKSTFIQHLNGLIKKTDGSMKVFDIDLDVRKPNYKLLRRKVGMVFQYPEYQLFDETVEKDIAFGPKNLGFNKEEVEKRVKDSMKLVGLDYDKVAKRSPFELSGGQKRRVAIAGVISMTPDVLILDEPTAGLDPKGKRDILNLITKLKKECSPTIIVISHDIDEISAYASKIAVFNGGKLEYYKKPIELFNQDSQRLIDIGLDIPSIIKIKNKLNQCGKDVNLDTLSQECLVNEILNKYKQKVK